jgi:hypothetical protein
MGNWRRVAETKGIHVKRVYRGREENLPQARNKFFINRLTRKYKFLVSALEDIKINQIEFLQLIWLMVMQ